MSALRGVTESLSWLTFHICEVCIWRVPPCRKFLQLTWHELWPSRSNASRSALRGSRVIVGHPEEGIRTLGVRSPVSSSHLSIWSCFCILTHESVHKCLGWAWVSAVTRQAPWTIPLIPAHGAPWMITFLPACAAPWTIPFLSAHAAVLEVAHPRCRTAVGWRPNWFVLRTLVFFTLEMLFGSQDCFCSGHPEY